MSKFGRRVAYCCIGIFVLGALVSCVPQTKRLEVKRELGNLGDRKQKALDPFHPGPPYFCPAESEYSDDARFCVRSGKALGPFTKKMVEACTSEAPKGVKCSDTEWPLGLAKRLRGTGVCPAGASETDTGFCAEGEEVYGPFVSERVDVCKAQKGGPACESNRWSIFFANISRTTPDPIVVPPASNEEAFERFIMPPVYTVMRDDKGFGYANSADAQHSRDLFYNGTKIFTAGTKESHCVGMTFQILIMAMNLYAKYEKDSRVWNMSPSSMKWEPFKNCWYVNEAEGKRCYGARDAIVRYGLGIAVKDFSDLKVGDFVNYDRASGYGHSVIFMNFIFADGSKSYKYRSDAVGFEYFSSQGPTNGPGKMDAYFEGRKCEDVGINDCGILKNSLVMGRVLHPSKFVRQPQNLSLTSSGPDTFKVTMPLKYLMGNR